MLKNLNYICFDFETTGLDPQKDEPIQIGIIKFDKDFKITDTYKTYIRPHKNISELKQIVSFITGLKLSDLSSAPYIEDVLDKIRSYFDENTVVIGHNIGFDMDFLNKYIEFVPYASIDTFTLSKAILHFLPSYALEVINDYIKDKKFALDFAKIQQENNIDESAHDAYYDSFMCYRLFYYYIDILQNLINKYPFLADVINKSDYHSAFLEFPKSPSKAFSLPSLKKEIHAERTIKSKDNYDLSVFKPKEKIYVGNIDIKTLLSGFVGSNKKLILSFAGLSKLKIARKMLNEIGIKNIGNLSENLVFDADNVKKFLNRDKYKGYEAHFLMKYLNHVENNISYLDLNSIEDYRVNNFLTNSKDKNLPKIVLSSHEGLWEAIKTRDLSEYNIAFMDRDYWYQSFSKYVNKIYDFYYLINFLESFIYSASYEAKSVKNLLKLYNFTLIFIGTLFSEVKNLFKNLSKSRLEYGPIAESIDFPNTNNLLLQFEDIINETKQEIDEQQFTQLKDKFDEYLSLFDRMVGINTKMSGNNDFYFVFYQIDNVINYYEFMEVFKDSKTVFVTNFDTNNAKKLDEIKSFQTTRNWEKIGKIDDVIQKLDSCDNVFVLCTNKDKSKEIFDKIIDLGICSSSKILVDNITGGIGKNIFYAKKTDKKLMIGGYEFLMGSIAGDVKIDKIIVYSAAGPLEKQIIQDLQRY